MNDKNWLAQQSEMLADCWSSAMQTYYPQYYRAWADPEEHLAWLYKDWNYLDAVKIIDWKKLFQRNKIKALDLGCGTGWLSAWLSRFEQIKSIDALDSNRYSLTQMLPAITKRMGGNLEKINPVLGFFSPLPVEDTTYDLIVASSSVHRAPSLLDLLQELRRVLKDDGVLVILNETPLTKQDWINRFNSTLTTINSSLQNGSYPEREHALSVSNVLYDPYLGNRAYSFDYLNFAFSRTHFSASKIVSPYTGRKHGKGDQKNKLTHFVCTKKEKTDIVSDADSMIVSFVRDFTMTPDIRVLNVIRSIEHIEVNNIAGDFVECGVWRGGASMAGMLASLRCGNMERDFYLYDTYDGMSAPTQNDIERASGKKASDILNEQKKDKKNHYWAYTPLQDVQKNISTTGYPLSKIHFIQGKVEETIPGVIPEKIALLRLDTDWYESTKHELIHLYPRLAVGGILIIDDYGTWEGSHRAVNEYFEHLNIQADLISIDGDAYFCVKK